MKLDEYLVWEVYVGLPFGYRRGFVHLFLAPSRVQKRCLVSAGTFNLEWFSLISPSKSEWLSASSCSPGARASDASTSASSGFGAVALEVDLHLVQES